MASCLNCGHQADDRFCPRCGQKQTPHRVSIWLLLRELASETFELDGRVPRTMIPFLLRPGALTREYSAGRRARYSSPFRLFLGATLLWVVAGYVGKDNVSLFDERDKVALVETAPDPEGSGEDGEDGEDDGEDEDLDRLGARAELRDSVLLSGFADRLTRFNALSEQEKQRRFTTAALETLPRVALCLLPVFALLLKLLHLRRGFFYVEHLVFALHVHAFAFVILSLMLLVPALASPLALTLPLYLLLALRGAYQRRWWTTILRFLVLGVFYSALLLLVTIVVSLLTSILS